MTHAPTQQIEVELDEARFHRARGAVVAAAAGDALGAPYEFQRAIARTDDVTMTGGGVLGWAPGEWTDDTALSIAVLEAVADAPEGLDPWDDAVLDEVCAAWYRWSLSTPDIGALTSTVISRAAAHARECGRVVPAAVDFRRAACDAHEQLPLVAGNGSLLRVHTAVLATLRRSEQDAVRMIGALGELTHVHPDVIAACLLWGSSLRHAILTGEVDLRRGLAWLEESQRDVWSARLEEAVRSEPADFPRNGWVVGAFQGACAAVAAVLPLPQDKFAAREAMTRGLEAAVRAGNDTDTVASITGAMLGAALGEKAVPPEWRRLLHGWPEADLEDLEMLVERIERRS